MGHIHLGHTPKWENWGTARNNWIKAGPNPIRATRNPILSCWVSGVPKGLGSPTPTTSIASLLRQLHFTSFHQKCFMVLLSSTSWVLHCSLGFTFTPEHKTPWLLCLSFFNACKTNTLWTVLPTYDGPGLLQPQLQWLFCADSGEHSLGSRFEREPFLWHPQLRLFFLVNLHFRKVETLLFVVLPVRPLYCCPRAECHVCFQWL